MIFRKPKFTRKSFGQRTQQASRRTSTGTDQTTAKITHGVGDQPTEEGGDMEIELDERRTSRGRSG
jgi:hypothetical protein